MDEDHSSHDQVAPGVGPHYPGHRQDRTVAVLLEILPSGLHPAPTLRPAEPARVPHGRLPRPGADPPRMGRVARHPRPEEGPRPLHPPEGGHSAARKKGVDALLGQTVAEARARRLIPAPCPGRPSTPPGSRPGSSAGTSPGGPSGPTSGGGNAPGPS